MSPRPPSVPDRGPGTGRRSRSTPEQARPTRARGADESAVRAFLEGLSRTLAAAAAPEVRLLGPAPAPVLKIRNLHRWHLRLQAPSPGPLQALLHATLPAISPPNGVELAVDVDPISLL